MNASAGQDVTSIAKDGGPGTTTRCGWARTCVLGNAPRTDVCPLRRRGRKLVSWLGHMAVDQCKRAITTAAGTSRLAWPSKMGRTDSINDREVQNDSR